MVLSGRAAILPCARFYGRVSRGDAEDAEEEKAEGEDAEEEDAEEENGEGLRPRRLFS
jgi:ribosomal protein L12E/L44/L45/RPP1/RPP2